jgi:hypothetical protein
MVTETHQHEGDERWRHNHEQRGGGPVDSLDEHAKHVPCEWTGQIKRGQRRGTGVPDMAWMRVPLHPRTSGARTESRCTSHRCHASRGPTCVHDREAQCSELSAAAGDRPDSGESYLSPTSVLSDRSATTEEFVAVFHDRNAVGSACTVAISKVGDTTRPYFFDLRIPSFRRTIPPRCPPSAVVRIFRRSCLPDAFSAFLMRPEMGNLLLISVVGAQGLEPWTR